MPCNGADRHRAIARTTNARLPPTSQAGIGGEEQENNSAVQRIAPQTVQRVGPDFEVKGESRSASTTPMSIFFDKDSSTVSPAEDAKFATLGWMPLPLVTLKGYSSEEEIGRPALVNNGLTRSRRN